METFDSDEPKSKIYHDEIDAQLFEAPYRKECKYFDTKWEENYHI